MAKTGLNQSQVNPFAEMLWQWRARFNVEDCSNSENAEKDQKAEDLSLSQDDDAVQTPDQDEIQS